jgi:AcrR family transcriptional regulator
MAFSPTATDMLPSAQERADRLVDAARALANQTGSAAFTVAEVVDRAGASLKGFYRSFGGKDDLLVALLEADSRVGAGLLAERVGRHRTPERRLRAFVEGIFALVTLPGATGYAGVLVREHRRLAEDRPATLRQALSPLIDLLAAEIAAASGAGVAASTDPARDASTLFALLLAGIHDVTVGAEPDDVAGHLWRFCWNGLQAR